MPLTHGAGPTPIPNPAEPPLSRQQAAAPPTATGIYTVATGLAAAAVVTDACGGGVKMVPMK
jgi:hypothetical protein